jgi:CBS domain-containing protein
MKVRQAMHKGVTWVDPSTPVAQLARLMREHDIGAIPIGENDRLVGMVSRIGTLSAAASQPGLIQRAQPRATS